MPAILSHYTFALSAIPEDEKPYKTLVNLGSQGPDTFMAYGSLPWVKREQVELIRGFGHTMHAIPIDKTYCKMMEYANQSPDKEMLYAYIDGLFMHYSVDRICHAYIFYRSGFDENGMLKGYWSWSHGAFEAVLDKVLATRKGTYRKLDECIRCDDDQIQIISKMWAYAAPVEIGENAFYWSYLDFVGAEKMLYTPHGLKRPLFRLIGKYSTPWAQSHPLFIHKFDKMDVENNAHSEWKDPCTGQVHHESMDDMLEMALKDYQEVHGLLFKAKEGVDVRNEITAWTKNLNHEAMPIGMQKKYHGLCWSVLGKKKYLPPHK
ncbi:MAG: zinc dependent phospholipase C family protein [Bacilli bacterium]|nr:zinc dependent phospholipase C family protein [Bacilli bacterium]